MQDLQGRTRHDLITCRRGCAGSKRSRAAARVGVVCGKGAESEHAVGRVASSGGDTSSRQFPLSPGVRVRLRVAA